MWSPPICVMFFRVKPAKGYRYLQIARSVRRGKTVRQEIIATLGRLDVLQESGRLDSLLRSGLRFARNVKVLDAHAAGETEPVAIARIGPHLVFGRLWKSMGLEAIVQDLAGKRRYEFNLERAIYLTVLHRLFASGSDRSAEVWKENYAIPGTEDICLHQLYRAMGWLGEEIGPGLMGAPRCTKDMIEEALFERGRDLFSEGGLVFFDTTSIYFEGQDAHDRAAILESLRKALKGGDKSLVGNKGFRRFLKSAGRGHFAIDEKQIAEDERYDGLFVLRTDTDHDAETVANVYKSLWMVEDTFRTAKSILETRPIYHKCDATIRGHVFCSFLALCLKRELEIRLEQKGLEAEWAEIIRGLDNLQEVELLLQGSRFLLRSEIKGHASQAIRAAEVAIPPVLQEIA